MQRNGPAAGRIGFGAFRHHPAAGHLVEDVGLAVGLQPKIELVQPVSLDALRVRDHVRREDAVCFVEREAVAAGAEPAPDGCLGLLAAE